MGHEYTMASVDRGSEEPEQEAQQHVKSQMRDDLLHRVQQHLYDTKDQYDDIEHGLARVSTVKACTTEQLWALYAYFILREKPFRILFLSDYLAIDCNGMFIGIETDGYTHS